MQIIAYILADDAGNANKGRQIRIIVFAWKSENLRAMVFICWLSDLEGVGTAQL